MKPLVPVPNFEVIAQILKPEHLVAVVADGIELFAAIKASTTPDPNWDGYIGCTWVGKRPIPRANNWEFRLWQGWRWALLCYVNTMSGECKKRGLECRAVPPEWGYNLRLTQLQAADENLREHWPGSGRFVPPWLVDASLGRQHKTALAALDPYYERFWPNDIY